MKQPSQSKPAGKYFEPDGPKLMQVLEIQRAKRQYGDKEDETRSIHQNSILKKDYHFYKGTDSVWNIPSRLSPKLYQYSNESEKFKKSPRDFVAMDNKFKERQQKKIMNQVLRQKSESQSRYIQRKLEREIRLDASIEVENLQQQDPQLFEELSFKKRWTFMSKDPSKILKDPNADKIGLWNQLNQLPPDKVKHLVTDKVLQMDQESCKMILENILRDHQDKDYKMNVQKMDRDALRMRLRTSHNRTIELEEKCGVRMSIQNMKRKDLSSQDAYNSDLPVDPIQEKLNQTRISNVSFNIFSGYRDIQQSTNQVVVNDNPLPQESFRQSSQMSKLSQTQEPFKLKYIAPKIYPTSEQIDILAMNKPEYHSKDFFAKQEFRGLFLADNQEVIGQKAFQCVEDLNERVLSKFKTLQSFNDQIRQSKTIQGFYKSIIIPSINNKSISTKGRLSTSVNDMSKNDRSTADYSMANKTELSFLQQQLMDTSKFEESKLTQTQETSTTNKTNNMINNLTFNTTAPTNNNKDQSYQVQTCRDQDLSIIEQESILTEKSQLRANTSANPRRNLSTMTNTAKFISPGDYKSVLRNSNKLQITDEDGITSGQKSVNKSVISNTSNHIRNHQRTGTSTMNKMKLEPINQNQYQTGPLNDYAETPMAEIEQFDKRFSKKGKRQFKYPNIELKKIKDLHHKEQQLMQNQIQVQLLS